MPREAKGALQRLRSCVDIRCVKVLALRRPDACCVCSTELAVGTRAIWDSDTRTVRCLQCAQPQSHEVLPPPQTDHASAAPAGHEKPTQADAATPAGASAQSEYRRRSQRREERIRQQHPRLGGLILALAGEPASTRVWAQGAEGERKVGATLEGLAGSHVSVLHDRAVRKPDGRISRANIDHLAVAPSGVWVIDAKTHKGTLQVKRSGGLLTPRTEKLYIGGRDQTKLLDGIAKQVEAVTAHLDSVQATVPVRGVLCFVGTELPWFGETIGGVPLVGRRGLAKLLKRDGELTADDCAALVQFLADRFPPAR